MVKVCTKCNQEKDIKNFCKQTGRKDGLRSWCKKCLHNWYVLHKESGRMKFIIRQYKTTKEEVDKRKKQQGSKCGICGQVGELVIDHDHTTGKFRGLLCSTCNKGLGHFSDSSVLLENAARYLGGTWQ